MKKTILGLILALGLFSFQSFAACKKISFPSGLNIDGQELRLNGVALRKKAFFINIYTAGLYTKAPAKNLKELLALPAPKYLRTHFLYSLSKEQINDAWEKSFKIFSPKEAKAFRPLFETITSNMVDVKKGKEMLISFLADRVEIVMAGRKLPIVKGASFSKNLLRFWFEKNEDGKREKTPVADGLLSQKSDC